jgi:hypothetical protein
MNDSLVKHWDTLPSETIIPALLSIYKDKTSQGEFIYGGAEFIEYCKTSRPNVFKKFLIIRVMR